MDDAQIQRCLDGLYYRLVAIEETTNNLRALVEAQSRQIDHLTARAQGANHVRASD